MIYRKLGKTDLELSLIGYGGWQLGEHGWGKWDINSAAKLLEICYENGINFYDTAPIYGFGKSEERIGEIFKGAREKIVIATKFGLVWNDTKWISHDLSRSSILREVELSLKRLKTDYIDIYQVHWLDSKTPLEELFETLNYLKKNGVIKHIGVCNFDIKNLEKSLKFSEIVSIQNQYNMLQTEVEKNILPFCKENNISFIPYSPLAQGLLTGGIDENFKLSKKDARKFNPLFNDKIKFSDSINFVKKLKKPVSKTALDYLIKREEVVSVIVGSRKVEHLLENLKVLENY
ncbi:aldo/keto reductase [Haliovirga abyssi]|uniref:General stress protein 69 n=1 Tax=Haliovirga abyssi TaxID=2996794 RepID=A0AAU9DE94_9FUSO|nr:aldo/keto reductase [Haliovirga abyssi]BDU50657.1 general stress protein 69 [Haliovirga abyssi]